MLTDKYINWEENDKIREILFDFLITNNITINEIDANDPEVCNTFYNIINYTFLIFYCKRDISLFLTTRKINFVFILFFLRLQITK